MSDTALQKRLKEQIGRKREAIETLKAKGLEAEIVEQANRELLEMALRLELTRDEYRGKSVDEVYAILQHERAVPVMGTRPKKPTAEALLAVLSRDSKKSLQATPDLSRFLDSFRQGGQAAADCVALLEGTETITKEEAAAVRSILAETEEYLVRTDYKPARIFKAFSGMSGPNEIPKETLAALLGDA